MDPQTALQLLQMSYSSLGASLKSDDRDAACAALRQLREHAEGLHAWLAMDGFMPKWSP